MLATALALGFLAAAYELYGHTNAPVRVRTVMPGTHFYAKQVMVILDRANWIDAGQLLTLSVLEDELRTPLALLRVEAFTSDHYAQCSVLAPLTADDLSTYLMERSRWRSMRASADVQSDYLLKGP